MQDKIFPIKEFPHDDRFWRLEWIDGISKNTHYSEELNVRLILRPIKNIEESSKNLSSISDVDIGDARIVEVGVGLFPLFSLGSIWKNGVRQNDLQAGEALSFENISIDVDTVKFEREGPKLDDECYIHRKYHVIVNAYRSKNLIVDIPNTSIALPKFGKLIIPAFEIIRFYYACSTKLAQAIFHDKFIYDLNSIIHTTEDAANDDEMLAFNQTTKTAKICVRKDYSDLDMKIIARFIFSKTAWDGVKYITNSKEVQAGMQDGIIRLGAVFPFTGETTLKTYGKRVEGIDGSWNFWVFKIVECSGEFPYRQLIGLRDNQNLIGMENGNTPRKPAWEGRIQGNVSSSTQIQSTTGAVTCINTTQIESSIGAFTNIRDLQIIKIRPLVNEYKNPGWITTSSAELDYLNTCSGGNTSDNTGHVNFNNENGSTELFSLDYIEVVRCLNSQIGVTASIRPPYPGQTDFLPLSRGIGKPQWGYLDYKRKGRRKIVVIDVSIEALPFIIIDFEKRDAQSDRYVIALVKSKNSQKIENTEIRKMMVRLEKEKGRWRNIAGIFASATIFGYSKHVFASPEQTAACLIMKMKSL